MGEKLNVVWAEFSTLSWAAFVMSGMIWHMQARPRLELKTRPRFYPVNISFSIRQGTLSEGEGSVQQTSLYSLV